MNRTEIVDGFERARRTDPVTGAVYWLARDLQKLLGYNKWGNFERAIDKGILSCGIGTSGKHFIPTSMEVPAGGGRTQSALDYRISRYGAYLIAMNSDVRKKEISQAQDYFAINTFFAEKTLDVSRDQVRMEARKNIALSEVLLTTVINKVKGPNDVDVYGMIRSAGDLALFGSKTATLKKQWGIKDTLAIADVMTIPLLTAKIRMHTLTADAVDAGECNSLDELIKIHVGNGIKVRDELIQLGITPEEMCPLEPCGYVREGMIGSPLKDKSVDIYKFKLSDTNVTGYMGVDRVDGMYVGKAVVNWSSSPLPTKLIAMLSAAKAAQGAPEESQEICLPPATVAVMVLPDCLRSMQWTSESEYLVSGYITRIFNGLDETYVGSLMTELPIELHTLKRQALTSLLDVKGKPYIVAESFIPHGIIVSIYKT